MTTKYKPGDRVEERVYLDGTHPETAEDVEKRDRDRRWKEWIESRPPRGHVALEMRGTGELFGASIAARTAEGLRTAARELEQLADWFEQKPVKP